MHSKLKFLYVTVLIYTLGISSGLYADENSQGNNDKNSNWQFSGFLSLVGGQVTQASNNTFNYNQLLQHCPCYIADWTNAGVYNSDWSFNPESRVGGQLTYHLTDPLSFTTQAVVRTADSDVELAWAYVDYHLTDHWSFQLGRKRIPIYFYSDFQDIGVAYPWISVPVALYGWEVTNFNGATLRYNNNINNIDLTASVFAGAEKVNDSQYNRLSYGYPGNEMHSSAEWDNLLGGDLEINKGFWTSRLMYLQADTKSTYRDGTILQQSSLKSYGVANNLDFDQFFILTEITESDRTDITTNRQHAFTIGSGYRLGKWTPFINHDRYKDSYDFIIDDTSLTLRYDVDAHTDVKIQLDRMDGDPAANYTGDTTLFRVSYDKTF